MTTKREAASLVDFARQLKRRDCLVCQLPPEIRDQLKAATEKGIRRNVVIAWLREEVNAPEITDTVLTGHYSGKHDDGS